MEERRTIGERLLERIDRRADGHVRPATTRAYEDRYSRFARTRGMSRLGLSLFPDAADTSIAPVADAADAAAPTFLSGQPFWARLRRIGAARLKRQQWLAGLGSKFGQRALKSRAAAAPTGISSWFGPEAISMDSLVLLEPEQTAEAEELAQAERLGTPGASGTASAWFTGSKFVPAPVIKGMRGGRPVERAESRAPAPSIIEKVVQQIVRAAKSGRPEITVEEVPATMSAKVRRAVRRQARRLGVGRVDAEAALPDEFAPPAAMAAGRVPARRGAKPRGLKTMAASSPMMSELAAAVEAPEAPVGGRMVARTAHRAPAAEEGRKLSASPVGRPVPVRRRAMPTTVGESYAEELSALGLNEGPSGDPRVAARVARPAERLAESTDSASILAADRLDASPARSGRARRARASYTSDPTVIVPDGAEATVAEDVAPTQPRRVAKPGAPVIRSTARVAQRAVAALEPAPSGRQAVAQPVAAPSDVAVSDRGMVRRASAVQRAPDGRFVSASPAVDLPQDVAAEASPPQAAGQRRPARVAQRPALPESDGSTPAPSTPRSVGASYAAERLANAEAQVEPPEQERSLIPKVVPTRRTMGDLVLPEAEPTPEAVAEQAEPQASVARKPSASSQAAARVSRTPLVGYTAARTAQPSSPSSVPRTRRPHRQGPVSYASSTPAPETITIAVPVEPAVPGQETAPGQVPSAEQAIQAARATHGTSRPLDWSGARVELATPESVPRAGTRTARARARSTDSGTFVSARTAQTARRATPVQGRSVEPGQTPTANLAPEPTVLQPSAPADVAFDEAQPEDRRVGFDHTVRGVGAGRVDSEMPIWAQRATGAPRIRGSEDLVDALAKAAKPDEVVQVLMERSSEMSTVASTLPTPVIQVINQIQTEAGKVAEEAAAPEPVAATSGRGRPSDRGQVRSSARVIRGMTGLRPSSGASRSSAGTQKVTALAQRLQQLIEMAERNRDSARREVRMAEDSSAARAEGSAAPAMDDGVQDSSVDVDALAQEVTEAVTRELEMRQERRLDDPTGRSIWWE